MSDIDPTTIDLIAAVESHVTDARAGLPDDVFLFATRITPMVNVDLLVRDARQRTLLTWRGAEFEWAPGWHIPGGIIRFKEHASDRIRAVARRELGTSVRFRAEPAAIREVIHPSRSDRGHFISILYVCELLGPPDPALRYAGGMPVAGQWAWHDGCPDDLITIHEPYRPFFARELPPFAMIPR